MILTLNSGKCSIDGANLMSHSTKYLFTPSQSVLPTRLIIQSILTQIETNSYWINIFVISYSYPGVQILILQSPHLCYVSWSIFSLCEESLLGAHLIFPFSCHFCLRNYCFKKKKHLSLLMAEMKRWVRYISTHFVFIDF